MEVLAPWRLSTHDVLATQVEVFEESHEEDSSHMTMPGGLDLNSHEDIFNALFTKVIQLCVAIQLKAEVCLKLEVICKIQ